MNCFMCISQGWLWQERFMNLFLTFLTLLRNMGQWVSLVRGERKVCIINKAWVCSIFLCQKWHIEITTCSGVAWAKFTAWLLPSYYSNKETYKKYTEKCLGEHFFFHFNFFLHCNVYGVPVIQHNLFLLYILIGWNWFGFVGEIGC